MSLSTDQLKELVSKVIACPNTVNDLADEEVVEVRKYLNPLGAVISNQKSYAIVGLTNMRDRYLRKLHMTAMIGYVFRMLEEYEPEEELEKEKELYSAACKNADKSTLASLKTHYESRVALIKSTAQGLIRRFLCRHFDFNPDNHLRSAHLDDKIDPDRNAAMEKINARCKIDAANASGIDEKLTLKPDMTYSYLRQMLLTVTHTSTEITKLIHEVLSQQGINEDIHGILCKKWSEMNRCTQDLMKVAAPLLAADTRAACDVRPPIDVFHQFDRYLTNHYEHLRDIVEALYAEKPDIEFSIQLHATPLTPESAKEYRTQHEAEFRTEVFTLENGGVTLMGPFKENRERVDFYNKNTEIMRLMCSQLEADHKLGKDLMEKQVKKQKKKNIREAGPDAPGLAAYSKAMGVVQELGVKKVLTKEEMDKLNEAKTEASRLEEDHEIPDDAIQIDVFFPENGGLSRGKFYSQAEAPLHMQDSSPYIECYQPKRGDSETLDTAYESVVIEGRDGKQREVKMAAGDVRKRVANRRNKHRI